jgi:hypothetical protein
MNQTKFIGALLMVMISANCFSQQYFMLGKADEVKEVQKRPVVIMLEEEEPKLLNKLTKKPDQLKFYKSEIKRANEAMIELAGQLWTFNAAPTVKTRSEVYKLKDGKNKEFAVIAFNRIEVYLWEKSGSFRYLASSKVIATLSVDLIENLDRGHPVFYQNLPNIYPTKGDLALGFQLMQNFLKARLEGKRRNEISDEAAENKSLLSSKTLLLDKEDIKKGLTAAQIKEVYPYPVKVVDYGEIETAILERNKDIAVVQIIPLTVGLPANAHIVMSTADGKSLAYYAPIQATTVAGKNTEARISQRHLKNYAK